jgi:hypothetical protein
VAVAVVVTAGSVWAGYAAWAAFQDRNSPSCSWPLRIRGTATSEQSGVVRCYLQALAERDTAGLMTVADDDRPSASPRRTSRTRPMRGPG